MKRVTIPVQKTMTADGTVFVRAKDVSAAISAIGLLLLVDRDSEAGVLNAAENLADLADRLVGTKEEQEARTASV